MDAAVATNAPRRRLHADDRRAAILSSARAHFEAAPYPEISVADVARSAGVSAALVHHYFGSKADLYAAATAHGIQQFEEHQRAADAALPPGVPARDRVRTMLEVYLDTIAANPRAWATPLLGGEEPRQAMDLRRESRARYAAALRELLRPDGASRREELSLAGYLGFVDEVCLAWASDDCPTEDRWSIIEACLGALEGALGDWGR